MFNNADYEKQEILLEEMNSLELVKKSTELKMRDYQESAVALTRESIVNGNRRPLIVLPTGSGKTIVYGEIIRLALEKCKKCLFLVHRRNLVTQFKDSLEKFFNINAGVIMAGHDFEHGKDVYVSTIQTYSRRINLYDIDINQWFIDADIVLTDESHISVSPIFKKVLDLYHSKVIIGTTATPQRSDGKGLGEVYDTLIDVSDTRMLTDRGFLSPVRYFALPVPDLESVKTRMGDYEKKELSKKMNKVKLVGNIVSNWLKLAENRQTIGFAVNVKHSIHIVEEFQRHGVASEHLDARSSEEERDGVLTRLRNGDTRVVFNVGLFVEGMDIPNINCVIMACPTKSLGKYRQACGRGMRISEECEDMILLDHGGIVERLGYLTDEIEWNLDGNEVAAKLKPEKKEKKMVKCQSCNQIFDGADKCPVCGSPIQSFGRAVDTADGDLKEIKGAKKKYTMADKRKYYGMLLWYVRDKGWSTGAASHRYRDKFGVWPKKMKSMSEIKPDVEFMNYQKHLMIKYAKRCAKNA